VRSAKAAPRRASATVACDAVGCRNQPGFSVPAGRLAACLSPGGDAGVSSGPPGEGAGGRPSRPVRGITDLLRRVARVASPVKRQANAAFGAVHRSQRTPKASRRRFGAPNSRGRHPRHRRGPAEPLAAEPRPTRGRGSRTDRRATNAATAGTRRRGCRPDGQSRPRNAHPVSGASAPVGGRARSTLARSALQTSPIIKGRSMSGGGDWAQRLTRAGMTVARCRGSGRMTRQSPYTQTYGRHNSVIADK